MTAVRRVGAVAAIAAALLLLVVGLIPSTGTAARADVAASALSKSGSGDFAGLKVTVDQTQHLINQVVHISWTGGAVTQPASSRFDVDFLQIMQCWGDDSGPKREQCQYGADAGDSRGGSFAASRQLSGPTDPAEKDYVKKPGDTDEPYVPFDAVTGEVYKGGAGTRNDFYDTYSTNEVPFARTYDDGKGEAFFEMQTATEAPGLGCGEAITGSDGKRVGRSCWLVVVPRGDREVDGTPASDNGGSSGLVSSPLSSTNWAQRIVFPLSFEPLGSSCALGSAERPTAGQESVLEAIGHWQPALCATTGTVYGYDEVPDVRARTLATQSNAPLAFVSRPAAVGEVPTGTHPQYGPVALGGLAVAYNVDVQPLFGASAQIKARAGSRVTDIRLTPRLVAKLLTQTYRLAVDFTAPEVEKNPTDLMHDEDFLRLNPDFRQQQVRVWDLHVPIGLSDATSTLWSWLDADPDAHAFLHGKPDPWGTVINPNFKAMPLPRDDFPKSDNYCADRGSQQPPYCTQDAHPYAADMHDGARSASRGDRLWRNWDPTAIPPQYKKAPPQADGTRSIMAVVDLATAQRFSLSTASLENRFGTFVAPDDKGVLAGLAAMRPSGVDGVVVPDPAAKSSGAYPLTTLTYAMVSQQQMSRAAAKSYAALLRYAVGPGQEPGLAPGQLPPGYVPLPQAQRAQTLALASSLMAGLPAKTPSPTAAAPATSGPSSSGSMGGSIGGGSGAGAPTASAAPSSAAPATVAPRRAAPTVATVSQRTPSAPVGAVRFVLAAVLVTGLLASVGGPVLLRFAPRLRR